MEKMLIPAWIREYAYHKINGCAVEVWNELVILSHTLQGMWLLIHTGIKVKPCKEQGSLGTAMLADDIDIYNNMKLLFFLSSFTIATIMNL